VWKTRQKLLACANPDDRGSCWLGRTALGDGATGMIGAAVAHNARGFEAMTSPVPLCSPLLTCPAGRPNRKIFHVISMASRVSRFPGHRACEARFCLQPRTNWQRQIGFKAASGKELRQQCGA
jgi:hypothetical protein